MQKTFNILFSFFILLTSIYHYDYWSNANTVSRAIFVKAMVDDNTLIIDKYHNQTNDIAYINGHYYSEKAPLPSLLVIPVYYAFQALGFNNINNHLINTIGDFIAGSLPFALIILITFFSLQKIKRTADNIFLSTLPFIGSFLFIYSGTFFAHVLTSGLMLVAYVFLHKKGKYFLSGMFGGMAVLCEYAMLVFTVIWMVQIIINSKKIKPALHFIAGGLPFAFFLMLYNYFTTGNAFDILYKHVPAFSEHAQTIGFTAFPKPVFMVQLLFGIYRGLLFFAPALIFILFIMVRNKSFGKRAFITDYLWLPCTVYFLLICSNNSWQGGWCYGPRFLTVVAVLLMYEGALIMRRRAYPQLWFYVLAGIGVVFTFMAKSTLTYSLPTEERNPLFNLIIPDFMNGRFNGNNLLTHFFGIDAVTANLLWIPFLLIPLFGFYRWQKRLSRPSIIIRKEV